MALLMTMVALAAGPELDTTHPSPRARRTCPAVCRHRRHVRRMRRTVRPYHAKLERMAWCESTGRWHIATGNGFYGGLQFTLSSWHWVGGSSYPHHATKLEQKFRAILLMRRQGWGAWPICQYA